MGTNLVFSHVLGFSEALGRADNKMLSQVFGLSEVSGRDGGGGILVFIRCLAS